MSAVRSIGKVSVAAWEVIATHRERGCLSASGVFRSMYLLGVIVAGFLALWNVVGFTRSHISTYRYYCTYLHVPTAASSSKKDPAPPLAAPSSLARATCLVDHRGNPVSEEVDREVSDEFNDVLELATRCCERGRYIWKTMTKEEQDADSASVSKVASGGGVVSSHREERDGASTVDSDRPSPGRRSALTEDGEEVSVAAPAPRLTKGFSTKD